MHYQSLGPVTKVSPAKCLGREKCSLGLLKLSNSIFPTKLKSMHSRDCDALDLHLLPYRDTWPVKLWLRVPNSDNALLECPGITIILFHPNGWKRVEIKSIAVPSCIFVTGSAKTRHVRILVHFLFLHKMYATVIYLPVAKFRGDIPFLCGVMEAFTRNTFFINCRTYNNCIPVKHC